MSKQALIEKEVLTAKTVERCLDFYPMVVEAVYKSSRPKLDQARILESDQWRYDLSGQIYAYDGLSKQELARLVQWKITHGTHRPFLPGMIEKNSPADVKKFTAAAAKILDPIDRTTLKAEIITAVSAALTEACKLHGVGPATGTLVLSILKPDIVPFFQDETFYWVVADYSTKLKYDKKEYAKLLEEILDISLRLDVDVKKLEKTAYVLSHHNELNDKQKNSLKDTTDAEAGSITAPPLSVDPEALREALSSAKKRKRSTANIDSSASTVTKPKISMRDAGARREASGNQSRRSKRQKSNTDATQPEESPDS